MLVLLLAVVLALAVLVIPLGWPGTWVMLAAGFGYNALAASTPGAGHIGTGTLIGTAVLALAAEVMEFVVSARAATRFGGSRRAGWGAMLGGMVGAFLGLPVPIPLVGPVLGAFVGAFVGAFGAELTARPDARGATRVATGAVVGRAIAAAGKTACGIVIATWLLVATW